MKLRGGFVSNSSSCSFVIAKIGLDENTIANLNEFLSTQDYNELRVKDDYIAIDLDYSVHFSYDYIPKYCREHQIIMSEGEYEGDALERLQERIITAGIEHDDNFYEDMIASADILSRKEFPESPLKALATESPEKVIKSLMKSFKKPEFDSSVKPRITLEMIREKINETYYDVPFIPVMEEDSNCIED